MLRSSGCGFTPSPTDSEPCGSKSTSSTLRPSSARVAPRLIVVVVLPTPPFWLQRATMVAGPPVGGPGSGRSGQGRPVGPITGSGISGSSVTGAPGTRNSSTTPAFSAGSKSASRSAPSTVVRPPDENSPALSDCCTPVLLVPGRADRQRARPARRALRVSLVRPRVRTQVHLAEMVDRHQRVDLRGGHRGVTEELLDDPHVRAAVQQVGSEGVPEGVGRDLRLDTGTFGDRAQDRPGALSGQPGAARVQEQRRRAAPPRRERRP